MVLNTEDPLSVGRDVRRLREVWICATEHGYLCGSKILFQCLDNVGPSLPQLIRCLSRLIKLDYETLGGHSLDTEVYLPLQ